MRAKLILPFLILYLFCHLLSVQGHEVDIVNAGSDKNVASSQVYEVTSEGAWCWFADPRALHYENEKGTINKTYVGYIDIHGNIKMRCSMTLKRKDRTRYCSVPIFSRMITIIRRFWYCRMNGL